MTLTPDEFLGETPRRSEDRVPRDRWGRYLIVPEGATEAVAHQRASTVAKYLEDSYGLHRWDVRTTARGYSLRPDLLAQFASIREDDKAALDRVCEAAKEAAAGSSGANKGKAVHTWTERLDLGEAITPPPDVVPMLNAYRTTLANAEVTILPQYVERYVVLPDLTVAGTLDRIVSFGSRLYVGDIKTGSVTHAAQSIAMQLSLYTRAATFYDFETRVHTPMVEVDQDVALVIHLPQDPGDVCNLFWVDVAAGWEAVQHALWVKEWRRRKDLLDPWDVSSFDVAMTRRAALSERIDTLRGIPGALQRLTLAWPRDVPTFKQAPTHTPEQYAAIAAALTTVEAQVKAPFGPLDPPDPEAEFNRSQDGTMPKGVEPL